MILESVRHPEWLSNTHLVADREGGAAVVIDGGGPAGPILERIRAGGLRVAHLLATHHHFDHVAECGLLKQATGARLCAHRLDAPGIDGLDKALDDGQVLRAGDLEIRVIHIPGHTAGQAAYLIDGQTCFTGDTLFRGSVGSTVAPGHTTFADLRRSIVDRLMSLPAATRLAPGHAESSTVGEELEGNPFVRVMLGLEPEGEARGRYGGSEVRIIVRARDYDGGSKAWVRFPDGREATVPGSRLDVL